MFVYLEYLYRDYYSSGNCDPDSLVTRKKQLLGCKVNKDERGNNVATYFGCSNEAMEPILPSSQTLYYGTYEYFDDSSCDSLLHYQSVVNKKCVTIGGPTSIFVDYPTQYIYNTPNCTGKPTTYTAFNQECTNYLHSSFVQRVMTEEQVELEDASYYFDTRPQFTYQSSSLLQGTPVQSNSNDGLSTGAIAGIAIGCVAAVTIVGFAIYYLVAFKFVSASAAQASSAAGVNGSVETSTIHNPVHAEEK